MRVETQNSPQRSQLGKLLEGFDEAMMTSANGHGALVSRPMAALEMDDAGALWFFTQPHSAKTDELRRVNLSFSDKSASTYVSLSGNAEINLDRERIERLWTPLAQPWFPKDSGAADVALLRFVPRMAEYWDAPHHRMVRLFAMAASVVTGTPMALGGREKLNDVGPPARAHAAGLRVW